MLNKRQFKWFSYLSSKWVIKQRRQLGTSTHLTQELLTNVQCSGGSRSFAKETRGLKMRSVVAGHLKLTTTIWERPSKLVLLQLHGKLRKNSISTILWSFSIWNKLERWKSSISGFLTRWPEIKTLFWSAVFSYSMQQQWSISWSDCDRQQKVDFIQQLAMPNLVWWDQETAPKHFPKLNLHQKKVMSLFAGLLPIWFTTAFWISVQPL